MFTEFVQAAFCTLIYLIPFLERDLLSSLPYIAASSLTQFPVDMHKEIMNYLIYHILPFAIRKCNYNFQKVYFFQRVCYPIFDSVNDEPNNIGYHYRFALFYYLNLFASCKIFRG